MKSKPGGQDLRGKNTPNNKLPQSKMDHVKKHIEYLPDSHELIHIRPGKKQTGNFSALSLHLEKHHATCISSESNREEKEKDKLLTNSHTNIHVA